MTVFNAIILGILQGIAEFLPVSSSGHLVIMRDLLGINSVPLLFDVLMHFPTLLAVVIVFRKRIAAIFISLFKFIKKKNSDADRENFRLVWLILITTIITGIVGIVFNELFKVFQSITGQDLFQAYPWLVGILFLITAGILILSKFYKGKKSYQNWGAKEGLFMGLAQGIGVLPGISRSGITISSSVIAGLEREKAGEFSFLISIPAILGATLLEFKDIEVMQIQPIVLITGLVTSFIVGLFSLILLMKLVRKGKLYFFSFYLIPAGITILIYFCRH